MKTLLTFCLAAALLAAPSAQAQTDIKPATKASSAQISVHWEILDVPSADWNRLRGDTKALVEAVQTGLYPTVSSPTVMTADDIEATVSTQKQVAFGPLEKRQFITVGTETKVKPHLNEDGSITLQLSLSDTELSGSPATPHDVPPTKSTRLRCIRTFHPNKTLILGSLIASNGKTGRIILLTPTVIPAK